MNEHQKSFTPPTDSHEIPFNEGCVEWIKSNDPCAIKGVALVIHGLNLRPDKMGSISVLLARSCIDVLNLSLRGHGTNYSQKANADGSKARMEAFKSVSYEYWIKETRRAYDIACKRSHDRQVPLFLVGFSMGALMGVTLFASYPDIHFNRMVLLAPALRINKIYLMVRLFFPFPKLVIPSVFMRSYCSNKGTPMAGYNALFEAIKHFNKDMTPKLNVPTIIFIDKMDELISYRRIKRIIKNERLHKWKLHLVKKNSKIAKEKMHHLIIDEPSVGKYTWNEMRELIINHLLP